MQIKIPVAVDMQLWEYHFGGWKKLDAVTKAGDIIADREIKTDGRKHIWIPVGFEPSAKPSKRCYLVSYAIMRPTPASPMYAMIELELKPGESLTFAVFVKIQNDLRDRFEPLGAIDVSIISISPLEGE